MITRYGWHVLDSSRKLGYDDERRVLVGKRLEYRDIDAEGEGAKARPPRICQQGMHAALTIDGARRYGGNNSDDLLCRVVVEGTNYSSRSNSANESGGSDYAKFVGSHRTVLGMITMWEYELLAEQYTGGELQEKIFQAMRARNRKNKNKTEVK